jgi:putative transposase
VVLTIKIDMSNLRRYNPNDRPVFVTNVVYQRKLILTSDIGLFWQAMESIKTKHSFDLIAWAILPDHFHFIIEPGESSISKILHDVKLSYSAYFRKSKGIRSGRIWQLRFWDHIIRDEIDFNRHLDYIHYNSVKHGIVAKPFDYLYSSIQQYREYYQDDWGVKEKINIDGDFGE